MIRTLLLAAALTATLASGAGALQGRMQTAVKLPEACQRLAQAGTPGHDMSGMTGGMRTAMQQSMQGMTG